MPRKREFDPERALDRAMRLFWRQGYDATSIADLVEAMEINRFSLYSTFGDKHSLFVSALERYSALVIADLLGPMEAAGASLPQLRCYFDRLVEWGDTKAGRHGCLLINSMAELSAVDPQVRRIAAGHLRRQIAAFRNALTRAVEVGELRGDLDVEGVAESMAVSANGVAVVVKTRPPREMVRRFVDGLFAPLLPARA